jgi:hypothetical protein
MGTDLTIRDSDCGDESGRRGEWWWYNTVAVEGCKWRLAADALKSSASGQKSWSI